MSEQIESSIAEFWKAFGQWSTFNGQDNESQHATSGKAAILRLARSAEGAIRAQSEVEKTAASLLGIALQHGIEVAQLRALVNPGRTLYFDYEPEQIAEIKSELDNLRSVLSAPLTTKEFADRAGVNESTVRRWAKHGDLPGADDSTGQWLIPRSTVPPKRNPRKAKRNLPAKPRRITPEYRYCRDCGETYSASAGSTCPKGHGNTEQHFQKRPVNRR
jgi:excisionase family DNA binding protein